MEPSTIQEGERAVRLRDGRKEGLQTATVGATPGAKPQQELVPDLPGTVVESGAPEAGLRPLLH